MFRAPLSGHAEQLPLSLRLTSEQYRQHLESLEAWANEQVDSYTFRGVRPVGTNAKVDEYLREAAIAMGNQVRYAREIVDIELALHYLTELLDAHFYGVPKESLGPPPNPLAQREAEWWEKLWTLRA